MCKSVDQNHVQTGDDTADHETRVAVEWVLLGPVQVVLSGS